MVLIEDSEYAGAYWRDSESKNNNNWNCVDNVDSEILGLMICAGKLAEELCNTVKPCKTYIMSHFWVLLGSDRPIRACERSIAEL